MYSTINLYIVKPLKLYMLSNPGALPIPEVIVKLCVFMSTGAGVDPANTLATVGRREPVGGSIHGMKQIYVCLSPFSYHILHVLIRSVSIRRG